MNKKLFIILSSIFLILKLFGQEAEMPVDSTEFTAEETPVLAKAVEKTQDTPVMTDETLLNTPAELSSNPLENPPLKEIVLYPHPTMDLKAKVKQIGWVSGDQFFALADDTAWLVNISDNTKEEIIPSEGFIVHLEGALKAKSKNKDLFTLTNTNQVAIRKIPLSEKYISKNYYPESPIRSAAFSPDGTFIATGHTNGRITLSMQLKLTNQIYNTDFFVQSEAITALRFSQKSDLLASISQDGFIDIWDLKDGEILTTLKSPKGNKYPVEFTPDSMNLISAANSKSIIVRDFDGQTIKEFQSAKTIKTFKLSSDGKYLFILSTDNNIYIYDFMTMEVKGYLPYFSVSEILDFELSENYDKILVSHKSGIIFLLNIKDVFLEIESPQPRLGSGTFYGGTGAGTYDQYGEIISSDMGLHNFDMRLSFSKPNYPYAVNITPQLGYLFKKPFQGFYFGGFAELGFCIPNPRFPYAYIDLNSGNTLHSPYILAPKISGAAGYYIKPFLKNIGYFVEIRPGVSIDTFWFPEYGLKDFYPSFNIDLLAGISWRQTSFLLGALYDYRLGFSVQAGFGWRIKAGGSG